MVRTTYAGTNTHACGWRAYTRGGAFLKTEPAPRYIYHPMQVKTFYGWHCDLPVGEAGTWGIKTEELRSVWRKSLGIGDRKALGILIESQAGQEEAMLRLNKFRFLKTMSKALDLNMEGLEDHHRKVAYISYRLGEKLNLTKAEKGDLVYLGLIHDIGVLRWDPRDEKIRLIAENEFEHCRRGALFLQDSYFDRYARYIFSHHDHYTGPNPSGLAGEEIPLLSRILFLADRLAVHFAPGKYLFEAARTYKKVLKNEKIFDPSLIEILCELMAVEEFWLTLEDLDILNLRLEEIGREIGDDEIITDARDIMCLGGFFAKLVDHKSPFTFLHSQLVGRFAGYLGKMLNFPETESVFFEIAGYLHDIGKMAVPDQILEKPGALTDEEFLHIKRHPFYTYYLLHPLFPLNVVRAAAYHHEKLDGSGYPFKKRGEELGLPERLLAVIDIFVALMEDRPYRKGLGYRELKNILIDLVAQNKIDGQMVKIVLDNYPELCDIKAKQQELCILRSVCRGGSQK